MSDQNGTDPKPADFSHLRKLHPTRKTATCPLVELEDPGAELVGVFCGDGAKDPRVTNHLFKGRRMKVPRTAADLDRSRLEFADYLATCVLTGWNKIVDAHGKPVDFTAENAAQFLKALPADVLFRVLLFFRSRDSFLAESEPDPIEERVETAGNS